MELLPSYTVKNHIREDVLNFLESAIYKIASPSEYSKDGVFYSRTFESHYHTPAAQEIKDVLDPILQEFLQGNFPVQTCHILESFSPYKIHTDTKSGDPQYAGNPAYTVILPLGNYDSYTVIFNEWLEDTNELAAYKATLSEKPTFRLDKKFCAERLSHLHPSDLHYLSLKEAHKWSRGNIFAMDRRYFHCSDNYSKRHEGKKGIVIHTNYGN